MELGCSLSLVPGETKTLQVRDRSQNEGRNCREVRRWLYALLMGNG